jgi:hypothetical protein
MSLLSNRQLGRLNSRYGQYGWVPLLSALLCLEAPAVLADEGRFEVTRAEIRAAETSWLLDARLDLELSSRVIKALESGVTLSFSVQFELIRQRNFWTDVKELTASQDFELKYMALNERYIVRNNTTGEQKSYATLFSALRNLGQIRDWAVVPLDRIDPEQTYSCDLRVVLNQDALPGPLQLITFWRGDFLLESEGYRWKLR